MERAERLLDLVALFLNVREAVSWSEIQESFPDDYARGSSEANIRKFERDKADLADLGLSLTYVQGEECEKDGYLLDRGAYYLPALELSPEELAIVYASGAAALEEEAFPFREDLAHALKKMAFAAGDAPGAGHDWSRAVRWEVPGPARSQRAELVDELSRAVAARKFVEFDYFAQTSGERTHRKVDPYGLVYRFGAWVLIGFCHLRQAQRSFRVDRIEGLKLNPAKPRSADFDVSATFRLADHAATHPWEFERHAPFEAQVRLSPEMAWVAERTFAGVRSTAEPRGSRLLTLEVRDQEALLRVLLPLGPGAEIVEPPILRQRMRGLLEGLLERLAQAAGSETEPKGAPATGLSGKLPSDGPGERTMHARS